MRPPPTGVKDADGLCAQRLQVARIKAAAAGGDAVQSLELLQEFATQLAEAGASDEDKGVVQLLLADINFQVRGLEPRIYPTPSAPQRV
jgi:hypothetical protein